MVYRERAYGQHVQRPDGPHDTDKSQDPSQPHGGSWAPRGFRV